MSSLPPSPTLLIDAVIYFDIDFLEGVPIEKTVSDLGGPIPENQEVEVFYFLDKSLQDSNDYDKMPITTIFFKNGIDFLRSTVLKEQDS